MVVLPPPPSPSCTFGQPGMGGGEVAPPPYNLNTPTHTILVILAVCGVWMGKQCGGWGQRGQCSISFHAFFTCPKFHILDGVDTHDFSFSPTPLLPWRFFSLAPSPILTFLKSAHSPFALKKIRKCRRKCHFEKILWDQKSKILNKNNENSVKRP
jgi:hypothetical protein